MLKHFFKNNLFLILTLLLTIPSYFSLIRPGFFYMQDDLQAFKLQQLDKCFQDWQIPCRWVPDAGFGYGYPEFIYYSPGIYYLGEFFHLIGFQFIDSIKLIFIFGFITSAVLMFIFINELVGELPGLVGTLLYIYIPFRATQVYVRGDLSEFWALAFFPLIFWSIYKFIKTTRKKFLLFFVLSIGLLLITHNLMSFIFLPLVGLWIVLWIFLQHQFKLIPTIFLGILLGVGLSAFFILPLIIERQYAHLETLTGGYFGFQQHFVTLYQLFISNHFGYGSSVLGPNDDIYLSLGIIHWPLAVISLILSGIYIKKNRKIFIMILWFLVATIIAAFLMHERSIFIWNIITPLKWLQFPWRFLAITSFFLSVLGGIAVFLIPHNRSRQLFSLVIIVLIFILFVPFFKPKVWYTITDKDKFTGKEWERQLTVSIFDYLPIYAKYPPNKEALDQPEVLNGKAEFIRYHKGSNFQQGIIKVDQEATVRVPLYAFPGMVVFIDGKSVNYRYDDCEKEDYCFGLITVKIPKGEHMIEVKLGETWDRQTGDIVSLVSLIIVTGGFIYVVKKGD